MRNMLSMREYATYFDVKFNVEVKVYGCICSICILSRILTCVSFSRMGSPLNMSSHIHILGTWLCAV